MKQLKCLGGFRNERSDYDFEGVKLELDKTMFAHGTVYEVEVETVSCLSALINIYPLQSAIARGMFIGSST